MHESRQEMHELVELYSHLFIPYSGSNNCIILLCGVFVVCYQRD